MATVQFNENVLVFFIFVLPSFFCQPPSFNPNDYIAFPSPCSLPFAVHLKTAHSNCSGTIINERWVLTAARCLYNDDETRVRDDEIELLAGAADFTKSRMPNAQVRHSQQVITHKQYIFNTLSKFDFGLIKVSTPFNLTQCVAKATIAADAWPSHDNRSKNCVSWGYGDIMAGRQSTRLKVWRSVALHSPKACPCANRFQAKRLICNAEAVGVNLCRGDLGSSLLCYQGRNPFNFWPNELKDTNTFTQKLEQEMNSVSFTHKGGTDAARFTVYGVAHMTIDKYRCDITRVPKGGCLSLPTHAAYMYLCPFNSWLRTHVPELPDNIDKCASPLTTSLCRTLLAVCMLVLLVVYNK